MPTSDPAAFSDSISQTILDAAGQLGSEPTSVRIRALEILNKAPGQPQAIKLLVSACRLTGDLPVAREILEEMVERQPAISAIHFQLGLVLRDLGDVDAAIAAVSRSVGLDPGQAEAWGVLADLLAGRNKRAAAAEAYATHIELGCVGFVRIENAALGSDEGLPNAETLLRKWHETHPHDLRALQLLGSVYLRLGRYEDAEEQLARALDLSPDFSDAGWMLAGTFAQRGNWQKTLLQIERLLETAPETARYLELKAYALLRLGDPQAVAAYEALVSKHPTAENWKNFGQALKAFGQRNQAVAAYHKSISLRRTYGRAYWCLAELKDFRFSADEIAAMREVVREPSLSQEDRGRIQFALGKALEDEKQRLDAFEQYRMANAAFRPARPQTSEQDRQSVRRLKTVFTPQFFRHRADWGSSSTAPIFIVGLPRSGTTLIEQILSSHSEIEPTAELQLLETVALRLSRAHGKLYPEMMPDLTADEIRGAGEEYLSAVQPYRKLNRPFFIDKMPINFTYLGLISTIFPNAKVIDVRRHPLGVGFGIFKHYFEKAYTFAFDLEDIGRYYRNYVELMAHFDVILPGRVHRVIYENMVTNTEQEIRRLLDYCGVPFEKSCLRFHETKRVVLTPSSEQVRRPIFTEGLDQWKDYEEQLKPLKASLGDVLQKYPEVPEFPDSGVVSEAQWQVRAGYAGGSFVRRYS